MRCPHCGVNDTQVKDSRPTEDNTAIRRRRDKATDMSERPRRAFQSQPSLFDPAATVGALG